ncbi:hypothetical protein ACIOJE_40190 [Kitasatospora sp. NPDC087861]|uniref:hypothetical protein n=1 Tax=Kitasatospora sp. NPDC087861 TaxID=3364070 RepID=UPI0038124F5A
MAGLGVEAERPADVLGVQAVADDLEQRLAGDPQAFEDPFGGGQLSGEVGDLLASVAASVAVVRVRTAGRHPSVVPDYVSCEPDTLICVSSL